MELVVNEWLPEYFRPDASEEQKRLLEFFLNKFYEKGDTIYIRRPSEFLRKIYRFAKDYHYDEKCYENITKFLNFILYESERAVWIDEVEQKLPSETIQRLSSGNYSSDTYLFEAAIHTSSKLIITTDERLAIQMRDDEVFKVQLLTDFLKAY